MKFPFIQKVKVHGFLSFREDDIELKPLNILIGANGSGKSNFIELFRMLQATSRSEGLIKMVSDMGGINEVLWKGKISGCNIEVEFPLPPPWAGRVPLIYKLTLGSEAGRLQIKEESLQAFLRGEEEKPYIFFTLRYGHGYVNEMEEGNGHKRDLKSHRRDLKPKDLKQNESALNQLRGPLYPEITKVSDFFNRIRVYCDWSFGRAAPLRGPQSPAGEEKYLNEDYSNLALVLNSIQGDKEAFESIEEAMRDFYEEFERLWIEIEQGTIRLSLFEKDFKKPISCVRLSDGTIRFLALLAVLCHPDPPPLVCIEEPELGMHPDVIPKIARLLREASERTQLVVTTHCPELVEQFTETPDVIMVCEKETDNSTKIKRLSKKKLKEWLEEYSLGRLWRKGVIGGNRF